MRILFLTQWFEPEPTFKGLAFAKELTARGHDVQVLTGFPNYPEGKLYPGYRIRAWSRETIDGISVIRVPLFPSHDNSRLRRVLNYLSFAVSASLLGPWLVREPDVVYVYHPPATIALAAIAIKLFRGSSFVYDVNDLWPDSLPATGLVTNRALLRCVELWCKLTYKMAEHIVTGSPGMKQVLEDRGVPANKITLIYNWVDEDKIVPIDRAESARREPMMAGKFNVVFAGNMGKAQALDAILDAAALIAARLPNVQFVFIGGGVDVDRLKRKKAELALSNVIFMPRRPMTGIASVLSLGDVLMVHLRDDPLFEITLPSKTQAYLAMGRPILMAVRGDAAKLVKAAGGGVSCAPEDADAIASAVERIVSMPQAMRDRMGLNGARYYQKELSLGVGSSRFEQVFTIAVRRH